MNVSSSDDWHRICHTFQTVWGYDSFRPPQGEIIQCLLQQQDAMVVMPTGAGKSLCFQLPALIQQGLTLVVSPLVALMENQVQDLQKRQLPAGLLHHQLSRERRQAVLTALEQQQLRLLYLSPETLLSPTVWQRLTQLKLPINGMIIDEAHCLTQWGQSFRPTYYRLGMVRPALLQQNNTSSWGIAAFTATADPKTQADIQEILQLKQPEVFSNSPYRSNLHLQVETIWSPRCRWHRLLKFIRSSKGESGLIYVRSRRESEKLAQKLQRLNYKTAAYHAGLSPRQRREIEQRWLKGDYPFVICTSAFGMGINKPDVRWVIHFQVPALLSEYLQEVGRGGRDGKPTKALAFISEPTGWLDPTDKQRYDFWLKQLHKQYLQAQKIASQIPPQGNIEAIKQQFPSGEMALSMMYQAHKLEWLDPFNYQLMKNQQDTSLVHAGVSQQQRQLEMRQYLQTKLCRWRFLLSSFGFLQAANGFNCGHCDNCQRRRGN
ncbi:MAG: ATP-dependent DNA helicase RecQ [Microcystaceae cyanobacterium]